MKLKQFVSIALAVGMAVSVTACGQKVEIKGLTLPESIEIEVGATATITPEFDFGESKLTDEEIEKVYEGN